MTVETTARKQQFTVASATADYAFTFRALTAAPTDIKCTITDATTGLDTELTYTTNYSVAIDADGIGGTVTLVSPSTYNGDTLTVYRETTNKQESDYDDYNQFPADTVETDLDKRTMKSQELAEDVARSAKLPVSSSITSLEFPSPVATRLLGWNAAATGLANYTAAGAGVTLFSLDDAYGNGSAVSIDTGVITLSSTIAGGALTISQNSVLGANSHALYITSNYAHIASDCALLKILQDNASATQPCIFIDNDGTGAVLDITQDGAAAAVIDMTVNGAATTGIRINTNNGAHFNLIGTPTVSAPANGDVWFNGTNLLIRVGGVTKTISWT